MPSGPPLMGARSVQGVLHFQLGRGEPMLHTRLRPHCRDFLEKVSRLYELHVFTFGSRLYAHTIAGERVAPIGPSVLWAGNTHTVVLISRRFLKDEGSAVSALLEPGPWDGQAPVPRKSVDSAPCFLGDRGLPGLLGLHGPVQVGLPHTAGQFGSRSGAQTRGTETLCTLTEDTVCGLSGNSPGATPPMLAAHTLQVQTQNGLCLPWKRAP